jgi:ATP-binding cassette, subfamily F, member 3
MLSLQQAGKRFGPRVLFLEADWLIRNDEKTALVGANGTGKSTLMKILCGLETLDYGTLEKTRGISIGYLPQEGLQLTGRTVFNECLKVFDELHEMEREIEQLAGQTGGARSQRLGVRIRCRAILAAARSLSRA